MTTATRTRPSVPTSRQAARIPRPATPRHEWPRPQLVHDHAALFREPVYEGGQPYATDDDLEDDEPAA